MHVRLKRTEWGFKNIAHVFPRLVQKVIEVIQEAVEDKFTVML